LAAQVKAQQAQQQQQQQQQQQEQAEAQAKVQQEQAQAKVQQEQAEAQAKVQQEQADDQAPECDQVQVEVEAKEDGGSGNSAGGGDGVGGAMEVEEEGGEQVKADAELSELAKLRAAYQTDNQQYELAILNADEGVALAEEFRENAKFYAVEAELADEYAKEDLLKEKALKAKTLASLQLLLQATKAQTVALRTKVAAAAAAGATEDLPMADMAISPRAAVSPRPGSGTKRTRDEQAASESEGKQEEDEAMAEGE
jgi:hypothetical protein